MTEEKACSKCGKSKPLDDFYHNASECKKCRSIIIKIYQEEHPEEIRNDRLKRRYGITLVDYDELLEEQSNGCAICSKTPEENGKRLSVDHDHKTEDVRGLLCSKCNIGLGMFRDNLVIVRNAVSYLEQI